MGTFNQQNRLPFGVYYSSVIVLALIGVFDSIYLSFSHYRVYTDMAYVSFCAISKAINCDTVSQSPYAILFGVPLPVWGVLGYAFFALIAFLGGQRQAQRRRLWPFLMILAALFCLSSVILALISSYLIHSYCIMCILSYAVNFGLLYTVWIIRRRFDSTPFHLALMEDWRYFLRYKRLFASVMGGTIAVGGLLLLVYPVYWQLAPPQENLKVKSGLDDAGHPYWGDPGAPVTITEFTDYQCFQCRKMHFFLRRLIAENPGRAKLIHRHFPMDRRVNPGLKTSLHVGSGKMAVLAIYASAKDKFWQMNDLLFEIAARKGNFNLKEVAKRTGIEPRELAWALKNKLAYRRLSMDIKDGGELGLEGTPGFVVDGEVYQGNLPADVLQRIFDIR